MATDLVKYQALSVITKVITIVVGTIQTIIIVRILSPAEYGLIGIVLGVGSLIGVYQHFGLASGTVREVARRKNLKEASKVFVTSLSIRSLVTFPLALLLFFSAGYIGTHIYDKPVICLALRLFSLILIFQGIQEIAAASLSGLQKFVQLFSFQIVSSIFAFIVFIVLVKHYRFYGYFSAMVITTFVMLVGLAWLVYNSFKRNIIVPVIEEFKKIFKTIFSVGLIIYGCKILFTFWQRAGILILGLFVLPKEVGYFNFALAFGTRLIFLSDAVTAVSRPVMSKKFVEEVYSFRESFKTNYKKIFALIFFVGISAIFFSREVTLLFVGPKYAPSFSILPCLIFAFLVYSLINVIGSSVLVPSGNEKYALYGYTILVFTSIVPAYLLVSMGLGLKGAAVGTLIGPVVAIIYYAVITYKRLEIDIFSKGINYLIVCLMPLIGVYFLSSNLALKITIFFIVSLIYLCVLVKLRIVDIQKLRKVGGVMPIKVKGK